MPKLRIERVPIAAYNLGLFGFSHLQLVFQHLENGDQGPQDGWYVIEGARDDSGTFAKLGVDGDNGQTTLSQANGNLTGFDLYEAIGSPEMRGSVVLATGVRAFDAWQTMAAFGSDIERQNLPYHAYGLPGSATPTMNSSSIVATLLYRAGFDIRHSLPEGLLFSPGTTTLIGAAHGEALSITNGFTTVVGGAGNDTLSGANAGSTTDKLYGGIGDDTIKWSDGFNIIHGGLPDESISADGVDSVDYDGAGIVYLNQFSYARSHSLPEYVATHSSGLDWLYSIERVEWDLDSDQIITSGNLRIIRDNILFDMKGEQSGQGDDISFESLANDLIINASGNDLVLVQAVDAANIDTGMWFQSAEWLTGSLGNDRIYVGAGQRGAEGERGDDILDGRNSTAFGGGSPQGYDIEMSGGEGADTIISGEGYSYAAGGAGADRFVLSAISPQSGELTEFVIGDAETIDRVMVPIDFFALNRGTFDTSELFPLLGGMAQIPGAASFAELPQTLGPWATGPIGRSDFFKFEWQTQNQVWTADDETRGLIEFTGGIFYNRDGGDLLIHVFTGYPLEVTDVVNDQSWTHTVNIIETLSETVIRVVDFHDGDLGIHFYDPGVPSEREITTSLGPSSVYDYPGWDAAVRAMLSGGLDEALPLRPEERTYGEEDAEERSSEARLSQTVQGNGGNNTLTGGRRDDTLDGGAGNDTMSGARGNDTYVVDSLGDRVIENAGAGVDTVRSSVNHYILPEFVEELELTGAALVGTGNSRDNTLAGNALANTLFGGDGEDGFFGGAGNDTLVGGSGNDGYFYALGDGYDVVRDNGGPAEHDILILSGINAADIHFFRPVSDANDLVLVFEGGGRVLADNYFAGGGNAFDGIMFSDGTEWDASALAARAAAAVRTGNEAPIAIDDADIGMRGGSMLIPFSVLTGNDADYERDALAVTAVRGLVAGVTVRLEADGVRVITPLTYSGAADFTYTVSDGHGGHDTASVDLTVLPNHAPVVHGSLANDTIQPGQAYRYAIPGTLFSDADGDRLGITAKLANGSALPSWLAFNEAAKTLTGTPPLGFSGRLDIVFTATDGAASVTAGYALTIASNSHAPDGIDDSGYRLAPGGTLRLTSAALTANDRDADGDALTITAVSAAQHGAVSLTSGGAIVFKAATGYTGPASFQYTVSDGHGGSDTATVSLLVTRNAALHAITGTNGANVLIGTSRGDSFEGRGGDDGMYGGAGDDVFHYSGAGAGRDVIVGGAGYDIVQGSGGNDIITLPADPRAFTVEAIDGGGGFDTLTGTAGADIIDLRNIHVTGIEQIAGGGGNDRITGSALTDRLQGGAGADVFVFSGNFGRDTILDFERGTTAAPRVDVIDLRDFHLGSFANLMSRATENGGSTVITLSASSSIHLDGIGKSSLKADDFLLV